MRGQAERKWGLSLLLAVIVGVARVEAAEPWLVGVGIGDVTGEALDVGMMGYAQATQRTSGIHQRQWARAFVIAEPEGKRVAIVVCDLAMIFQAVHQEVMKRLAAKFSERYREDNVLLTATHTHSGPGGFSHYRAYNMSTFGFQPKTFEAIVAGIVRAIERADADAAPGTIAIGQGELTNASVNRSPEAYLRNPEDERNAHGGNIDPEMVVLRFERGGTPVGALSWFAVHPVSITNRNTLISPDNKGYASYHWEHDVMGVGAADRGRFVAAFANSNPGDMSPNIRDGVAQSPGPTDDEFENSRIIGTRQYDAARAIFDAATEPLAGPVDSRFRYVDFSTVEIDDRFTGGGARHTCKAAFGQSFAAGTEDGRGLPWIHEGATEPDRVLGWVGWLLAAPSEEVRACQAPKIVVLSTGEKDPPWSPEVLPVQVLRVGQLAIAAAPGEFTIMSGRRVRQTIAAALPEATHVVFTGYANAYVGYVTTPEEYEAMHYECGFTHFGKWTLPAWQQALEKLAVAIRDGQKVENELRPRDISASQWTFNPGVIADFAPPGRHFGEVIVEPRERYRRGDAMFTIFLTGNPRNDVRAEGSFLEVQRRDDEGTWKTIATDDDWSTEYQLERKYIVVKHARIVWRIPEDAAPGTYRILHHGEAKNLLGGTVSFSGRTRSFGVE